MPIPKHLRSNKWLYTAIIASIFLFYWFQIRPITVYRQCAIEASVDARKLLVSKAAIASGENAAQYNALMSKNMYLRSDYDSFLQKCLLFHGLPAASLDPDADVTTPAE